MKPEHIITDPCQDCPEKQEDEYGYLCNLACGRRSAYLNQLYGARLMLKSILESSEEE